MPTATPPPRHLLPLGAADFLLLAVLQEEPMHGYGLSKAMAERSEGSVSVRPGDMYRLLHRLVEQGLVEIVSQEPGERGRMSYGLSALGARVLRAEAQRLSDLTRQVLARATAAEEPR